MKTESKAELLTELQVLIERSRRLLEKHNKITAEFEEIRQRLESLREAYKRASTQF